MLAWSNAKEIESFSVCVYVCVCVCVRECVSVSLRERDRKKCEYVRDCDVCMYLRERERV